MNPGQEFEAVVENLAFGGEGIVKINGFVIFIKGALPGQKIKAFISKNKKNYGEAKIIEILNKSPLEIKAKCQHFGKCGGCSWQNLKYETQLEYKEKQAIECIENIGAIKYDKGKINKILGSPKTFGYRNKVEFSFGYEKMSVSKDQNGKKVFNDTGETLGFHKTGKWQEVIEISDCELISENANKILNIVKNWCISKKDFHCYNPYSHKGIWRHLLIRENLKGEIMINLIIKLEEKIDYKIFFKELVERLQSNNVKAFFVTINNGLNDDWLNSRPELIFGDNVIYENILNLNFAISPKSFFQTNSLGSEVLYSTVKKFALESGNDKKIILDLYCGTGTIGQILASSFQNQNTKVIGIESVNSAIDDAIQNAKLNGLNNTEFICRKVEDILPNVITEYNKIDLAVIDPPRSGMHKKALETLLHHSPSQIVYVSCNPSTFSRDFETLKEKYDLIEIQTVDMFPHTPHIEMVGNLKLKY